MKGLGKVGVSKGEQGGKVEKGSEITGLSETKALQE